MLFRNVILKNCAYNAQCRFWQKISPNFHSSCLKSPSERKTRKLCERQVRKFSKNFEHPARKFARKFRRFQISERIPRKKLRNTILRRFSPDKILKVKGIISQKLRTYALLCFSPEKLGHFRNFRKISQIPPEKCTKNFGKFRNIFSFRWHGKSEISLAGFRWPEFSNFSQNYFPRNFEKIFRGKKFPDIQTFREKSSRFG